MFQWEPHYWKAWRESADPCHQLKSARDRELALELVEPRDGERILEVGCGYGWISRVLRDAARIGWVGVDASLGMVRQARFSLDGALAAACAADARDLPFADRSFDKILCSGVLMHVADEFRALQEMTRVLRPGGKLVVSMNNAFSLLSFPAWVINLRREGYVQKFHRPGTYETFLRRLGLELRAVHGDAIFATISVRLGRFHFPPRRAVRALAALDRRAVSRWPKLAYEVWFVAVKAPSACAS